MPEQGYADIARPLIEDEAFTLLGDLENVTLTAVHPRERTFVRVLSGDDGVVVAGTYWAQGEQYLDLATEFEDGHTISTTTATPAGFLTARPNVERHVEDAHTPPLSLLALHRKLVAEHQRATGALPLRIL
ncbi:MAG: hypothetical protein MUF51_12065, partial [Vicinamibacteria bacterium]|nr:hypothetical protein [Vicinamibacteria bacterium]